MDKLGVSTLLLRLVLGISFLVHGLVKFQGGIANTVGWFESIGILGFFAYAVATLELVGGIALILGIGTRIVSAFIVVLMIGAIVKVKFAIGFLGIPEMAGYELDLAFLVIALFLAINGSKFLSIDETFFK
ncbi:DoxX family protein [Psychrobacillus soli]|uniref:DoxX family protein n=1 Tax=Psychrobacillus soli TaxID=1543965 RepID=A0A544SGD6_9BACI|nr:DoxX family protein [Psychrobacillus soli]TQR04263.1 DoxX family protein [Psychrobacillus soli]